MQALLDRFLDWFFGPERQPEYPNPDQTLYIRLLNAVPTRPTALEEALAAGYGIELSESV